jgi:hypothetical protein
VPLLARGDRGARWTQARADQHGHVGLFRSQVYASDLPEIGTESGHGQRTGGDPNRA